MPGISDALLGVISGNTMSRKWVLVGIGCATAALVVLSGGLAVRPSSATPHRLVIGVRGDVTSLNVYTAASAFDQEIADLLYPRLAYEEDDFGKGPPTFRAGVATSWDFSPDRT